MHTSGTICQASIMAIMCAHVDLTVMITLSFLLSSNVTFERREGGQIIPCMQHLKMFVLPRLSRLGALLVILGY